MSQPLRLFELQKTDSALDRARARLAEIEAALRGNPAVQKAEGEHESARLRQHEAQTALRNAEAEVSAQQEKIDSNQRALYGGSITNPKELADLQHEAEALGRHLARLEEIQLEAMVAFEEADQALAVALTTLEAAKNAAAADNQAMLGEQKTLLAQVHTLDSARSGLLPDIAAEGLTLYESLRKSRKGLAVVAVSEPECPACGATLTAAQAQAARSPNQLAQCADCGRIMVSG